jgi:DHA1 family multidrug resistance protein-like MFS transporter
VARTDGHHMGSPHRNDWRLSVVLFGFASFAESMAFGHFNAFTPLYLADLGLRGAAVTTWTGLLGSAGFVLGLPLLPFWGAFAERFGRKPVIVRSSVVEAVIFLTAALARSPLDLLLSRLLSGFVMGNTGVMMAVQSEITPAKRLGLAVAVIGSGPSLATALGPLFGGVVVAHLGLRPLFLLDAAATFLAASLLTALLREEPRPRTGASVTSLARTALADVVRLPIVRRVFLLYLLVTFGLTATQPFLPLWVHDARHATPLVLPGMPLPEVIGLVFTVAGVAMAVATPLWGVAVDRLGPLLCLRAASTGTALSLFLQGAEASLPLLIAGRAVQGAFQGGVTPTLTAVLARTTPPERRSSILNLSILPQQLGWFFGPLTATGLAHLLGIQDMILTFGALTALGALLSLGQSLAAQTMAPR